LKKYGKRKREIIRGKETKQYLENLSKEKENEKLVFEVLEKGLRM
jgi:hypothetical protein